LSSIRTKINVPAYSFQNLKINPFNSSLSHNNVFNITLFVIHILFRIMGCSKFTLCAFFILILANSDITKEKLLEMFDLVLNNKRAKSFKFYKFLYWDIHILDEILTLFHQNLQGIFVILLTI